MLENCILCEKMKLRRSPMWIAFVLFPIAKDLLTREIEPWAISNS